HLFCSRVPAHRDPPSFPTRRSSDLGLASGMMISTFQIGAALGVAIIGGVFYSLLGPHPQADDYAHAFTIALGCNVALLALGGWLDRKSTRLNSSHVSISYAVFCLKK